MAKKTNPTTAKTAKKKPVTMADLHKRLKDVEAMYHLQNTRHITLQTRVRLLEDFGPPPQGVTGTPEAIKVTIPEQGLEPGDYTDASKEGADALTAMGCITDHANGYEWIKWYGGPAIHFGDIEKAACHGKYYPPAEFLARAAVTAKALGLVAKKEEPWKPEVGELVVLPERSFFFDAGPSA